MDCQFAILANRPKPFEMNAIKGVELLEFTINKLEIHQLGPKAIAKISGKAWDELRFNLLIVCGLLLDVSPDAFGELTTTYAKFTIGNTHTSRVYASMWVKNSKSFTVGFALPDDRKHPLFTDAPKGRFNVGEVSEFILSSRYGL